MADFNLNALIYIDAPAPAATGFEDSLNFGAELPEDELVTEVTVDPKAIVDLIPQDDEIKAEAAVLESRHNEWSYLREDIINARGMSQGLATEAIAIKSDFGRGKPLAYYSRHVSRTQYNASLEEIDQTMQSDLIRYLENTKTRLDKVVDESDYLNVETKQRWVDLSGNLALFGVHFADAVKLTNVKNEPWNDQDLITKTSQPREEYVQQALVNHFTKPVGFLAAMVDQDQYYTIAQHFSDILDLYGNHCDIWKDAIERYTEALGNADLKQLPKFELPEELSFALADGSTVSYNKLHERLAQEHANANGYESKREEPLTIDNFLFAAATTSQQSGIDKAIESYIVLKDKVDSYKETISNLLDAVAKFDKFSDELTILVDDVNKFITKLFNLYQCLVYVLACFSEYILSFTQALLKVIGLTLLVVETKDKELEQLTDPAIQEDAPFLPSWKELVAKMYESITNSVPQ